MTKAVAIAKNVQALPYNLPTHKQHPEWQGTWTAEPIETKTYHYFNINSKPIAYEVKCKFNFIGSDPNGSSVTDTETITLKAKETILQKSVLCHGDEKIGDQGNKLHIQSNNHLTTD